MLRDVYDLYGLSIIEEDLLCFLGHKQLTTTRAKAVTTDINNLVEKLRPPTLTLFEAFRKLENSLREAFLKPDFPFLNGSVGGLGEAAGALTEVAQD